MQAIWVLITKLWPPMPPQPQIPPSIVIPPGTTPADIDEQIRLSKAKVSYCPLLMDPSVTDYDYIDEELRQTIYDCMMNSPENRPTLEVLLAQAKAGVQKNFSGEDDGYVKRWIRRWM